MKKKFSLAWKASKQKRKQRKYLANAPVHIRHKLLAANLSKELRKKYLRRSFPLRKGDVVKVLRGSFRGKSGKIIGVNIKKLIVYVENLQRTKKDGSKVNVQFRPFNLQITELNLDDRRRIEALERINKQKMKNKQKQIGK